MTERQVRGLWALVGLLLTSCATLPSGRPLAPGEHEVGLTLGGPMVDVGPTIPMPMAVLEGKHGVAELADRPLDVSYGLNATASLFGVLQLHVGGSWLLVHESGWIPALAVTDRLFFAANIFDPEEAADPPVGLWAADQLELTASWLFWEQLLLSLGVSEYLDFSAPSLLLAPSLGLWWDPGAPGGFGFGGEARWFGINRRPDVDTVKWRPGPNGALGFSLGVSYAFK